MAEPPTQIDYRALLDGMGEGVLLFDADGKLVLDNLPARSILGPNLMHIRTRGWSSLAELLDQSRAQDAPGLNQLREQALRSPNPIRFHTFMGGVHTPGWITGVYNARGAVFSMVVLERADWQPLTEIMTTFRNEARMSISATRGHAELIKQIVLQNSKTPEVERLGKRVLGFTDIISTHMLRLQNLMNLLQRLELLRTGALPRLVREQRRKLRLSDFLEDFLEELADEALGDPDMGGGDFRDRLTVDVPDTLEILASPEHLGYALRDLLRNAACYSPAGSPIDLRARLELNRQHVRIDVNDQGYGIRASEYGRVFAPFQRARQPQIIGVDGYGLSLYLVQAEVQVMGGRIWFESVEGAGSTFSFTLPVRASGETQL